MKRGIVIVYFLCAIYGLFSQDLVDRKLQALLPRECWYDVFYLKLLQQKDRSSALDYLPFHRENPRMYFEHLDAERSWYEEDFWPSYDLVMDDEGFGAFGHIFDTVEVKQIHSEKIFYVTLYVSDNYQKRNDERDQASYHNWDLTRSREKLAFLFVFDRDFLDIFVDDFSKHLATFCRYDDATKKEILHLFNNNNFDESKVTWPRRDNKNHVIGSSCIVIESLRLRKEENTTSAILQTMDRGTPVKITALGKKQTIDGITANWVKVQLDNGTEGWCFGGYLVDITR